MEPSGAGGEHGQQPRFVGCRPDEDATRQNKPETTLTVKGKTAVTSFAQHDVAFACSKEPVEVPNTQHYRDGVFVNDMTGHSGLIAADLDTAKACGISAAQFRNPLVVLEELRAEAIERFAASNSEITVEDLIERLPPVFALPEPCKPPQGEKTKASKPSTPDEKAPIGGNS
jgi:hypothetical protein